MDPEMKWFLHFCFQHWLCFKTSLQIWWGEICCIVRYHGNWNNGKNHLLLASSSAKSVAFSFALFSSYALSRYKFDNFSFDKFAKESVFKKKPTINKSLLSCLYTPAFELFFIILFCGNLFRLKTFLHREKRSWLKDFIIDSFN